MSYGYASGFEFFWTKWFSSKAELSLSSIIMIRFSLSLTLSLDAVLWSLLLFWNSAFFLSIQSTIWLTSVLLNTTFYQRWSHFVFISYWKTIHFTAKIVEFHGSRAKFNFRRFENAKTIRSMHGRWWTSVSIGIRKKSIEMTQCDFLPSRSSAICGATKFVCKQLSRFLCVICSTKQL